MPWDAHAAGFVQVHDGRAAHEGDGDAQAPPHAAAEAADGLPRHAEQVDGVQAALDCGLELCTLRSLTAKRASAGGSFYRPTAGTGRRGAEARHKSM